MSFRREIKAWKNGSLLFEEYIYCGGKNQPLDAHSHPEYQIGLAVNTLGKYVFRQGSRYTPPKSLSVIHSGELHRPDGFFPQDKSFGYLMLYVPPEELLAAAQEIGWHKSNELPFFKEFTFNNRALLRKYIYLHQISAQTDATLAIEIAKTDFLSLLVKNFSQVKKVSNSLNSHQKAIAVAREYLDAHFTKQISLAELANVAGISKYHLCRIFAGIVGTSPHVYQIQLRLNHAKKMLVERKEVSAIAQELGFYDQSHFGKYFKKFSGTTPRRYSDQAIFS